MQEKEISLRSLKIGITGKSDYRALNNLFEYEPPLTRQQRRKQERETKKKK